MAVLIPTLTGLLSVALLVLVVRGRKQNYCYAFVAYLVVQVILNIVMFVWPGSFDSWSAWAAKEALYALLRVLVLAELGLLIFRTLPRARKRVYIVLSMTALVLLVVLSLRYDATSPYTLAKDITSRFDYVTAWGLIALLVLVVWYQLPLHSFHKAILHGMLWLLLAHFAAVYAAKIIGGLLAGRLYNVVQLTILGAWVRAAWAADPPVGPDEVVVIRYLQPWRAQ